MTLVSRLSKDISLHLEGIDIVCRQSDGYINASALCKAGGKKLKHWLENANSKALIPEVSALAGIPANDVIKYTSGSNAERATWVHQDIAISIAQWISPRFTARVSKWVRELLTFGNVTYGKERSEDDLRNEQIRQLKTENIKQKQELLDVKSSLAKLAHHLNITSDFLKTSVEICNDMVERLSRTVPYSVPIHTPFIMFETISLFKVTNKETGALECHYLLAVQKKSYTTKFKALITKHIDYDFDVVYMNEILPNATIVRQRIKDGIGEMAVMRYNTITINNNFVENDLIRLIVRIVNEAAQSVDNVINSTDTKLRAVTEHTVPAIEVQ